jgi:hypothetical protein
MNQMKRAELIIGKSYYMNSKADWRGYHYGLSESYAKTADSLSYCKVTVVETQLKTEYDKNYRTRDVLIQKSNGKQVWVPLNHIRCTFIEAVKILTQDKRDMQNHNSATYRYQRHLQRKFEREQFAPALKTMLEEIERVTGEHVYSWSKMETLEYETIKKLTQALSCIKTDLQAVAS